MTDFIYLASQSPRRRQLLDQLGVRHVLLLPHAAGEEAEDAEGLEAALPGELPDAYVQRVTDVSKWDSLAVKVLELDLALELSKKITDSNPDVQALYEMRRMALRDAKVADAVETPPGDTGPDDFILARGDGGVYSYWPRYV